VTVGPAALPMYDWPEVRPATDKLWERLRDALRAADIDAPDRLTRDREIADVWLDPELVLGQTCGLSLVRELSGRVAALGALDFGVPGCAAGWYRSAVVARADDPRKALSDFRDARLAINGRDSQSGYGAILHHAAPLARKGGFFAHTEVTGAHAASVARIAEGEADIAAIDFVSWGLARRFMPEATRLRMLMLTDPTPGVPLIAAPGADVATYRGAITRAVRGLDAATRSELSLQGFAALDAADYRIIGDRLAAAEARLEI
jgi:ABC-type phosphate/phosphonate transport system substrate-binding protein